MERGGDMPRSRKPLSQQKGNLTVLQQTKKKLAENSIKAKKDRLLEPPSYLVNHIAIEEWEAVTSELKSIDIVGNLDMGNLVVYCNAFADYVEATIHCSTESKVIERDTQNGTILLRNPWVDLQKGYADEMRKAGAKCGIDVNARLKAATVKVDTEQEEIARKFGGI
jgi:P27 family predicted phage terminase small subunit